MKFLITRTSEWGDKQPYKNAYLDSFIQVDTRTVDNPQKLNHRGDRVNWYEQGENHRVEDGYIKRDFQREGWFIDIGNLEELIKLHEKVGEDIIITNSMWNRGLLELEIYDTYRE